MTFAPTDEQNQIIEAAQTTDDNLLITAYAGAAKTTTLELIANALPSTRILTLAFNKKIAEEMKLRLPENCSCRTLSSLGYGIWRESCPHKLNLDKSKTYRIVSGIIETAFSGQPDEQRQLYDRLADLMRVVDFGNQCGYVPTDEFPSAKELLNDTEFIEHIDDELNETERWVVREATVKSIKECFQGNINFNDMLFMPTIFRGAFPSFPLVLVDEAQDLSALNHRMLQKLVNSGSKPSRLIAVGDECQAIYGFRGAHQNSMQLLQKSFHMQEHKLSISFRCAQNIVKEAQWRAPDMKAPGWAVEGRVESWKTWKGEDIPDHAAVICRNNAPLFAMAVSLLLAGKRPTVAGNDVVMSLIKILEKWKPRTKAWPTQEEVLAKIDKWETQNAAKVKRKGPVKDKAECLRIFAMQGRDLREIIEYSKAFISMHGTIQLMTGHKAKGLEFDNVFFLDQELVSDKDQDPNLRYVIQTRAKENLTYISTDLMLENQEREADDKL